MVELMDNAKEPRYFINSLARGLAILNLFTSSENGYTLSEIATLGGMSHATANRYIYTLRKLDYLLQDPTTKKYRPAAKMISFVLPLLRNMDLRSRLMPYLIELRKEFDIAASCAILVGKEIVFLERIRSGSFVEVDFAIGSQAPAYCTSLGKAIMAFSPSDKIEKIMDDTEFVRQTPNTILDKEKLLKDLFAIKQRGYAINNQELVLGLRSIAFPVFNGTDVEGALGVTYHVDRERAADWEQTIITRLKEIAENNSI